MGVELVGPHDQWGDAAGLAWAREANAVKSHGNSGAIQAAKPGALKIWRGRLEEAAAFAYVDRMDVEGYTAAQIAPLNGWGAGDPNLFIEGPNEPGRARSRRLVAFYRRYKVLLAQAGYQACGFCHATGDYEAEDVEMMREAELPLWTFHCYFSREIGPTQWNAERPLMFWKEGDPPWVASEWGFDRTRDGAGGVYVPKGGGPFGWEKQFAGRPDPAGDAFVMLVAAANRVNHKSCRGLLLYTTSPDPTWRDKGYGSDVFAPRFLALQAGMHAPPAAPTPAPAPPVAVVTPPDPEPAPPAPHQELSPMFKRAYLHQHDQLSEKSISEIAATLRLADIREIACKTHQATTWLGKATDGDKSPLAFRSLEDVREHERAFAAEGIRMVGWCVPMGEDVPGEARFTADVAEALDGSIELDLEDWPGFWDGPKDQLDAFLDGLDAKDVAYEINFDARNAGWAAFGEPQFMAAVRRARLVWTQSYWSDFQQPALGVVQAALGVLEHFGIPPSRSGVILPWNGPDDYAAVAAALTVAGVQRIGMWRMGAAGPATFRALAAIPTSAPETPAPPQTVDVSSIRDELDALWGYGREQKERGQNTQDQVVAIKQKLGIP